MQLFTLHNCIYVIEYISFARFSPRRIFETYLHIYSDFDAFILRYSSKLYNLLNNIRPNSVFFSFQVRNSQMRKKDTHNYRNICLESFMNYVDKHGRGFSQKSAYDDSKLVCEGGEGRGLEGGIESSKSIQLNL